MMPAQNQSAGEERNTPHPSTHCGKILAHLQEGKTLTGMVALNLFGCWALAQRIKNLRDDGYPIKTTMVKTPTGKHIAEYSLEVSKS
jgi:hypothetical protein